MPSQSDIRSILLVGTENSVALPLIRSLGSNLPGVPIHILSKDNGRHQGARYSRYVQSHHYLQSDTQEGLLEELKIRVKVHHATILLPVDEYFVRLLSTLKQELEKSVCLPPLPDPELLDSLIYKNRLNELLIKFNFPSAITFPLTEVKKSSIDREFFPCLLKPIHGSSGWGVVKISDHKMLARRTERLNRKEYILQEYIPGTDIGCSVLASNGEIKALTTQKSLEKIGYNFSTAIQFTHVPDVVELVEKLILATGFSGIADMDFRIDTRDGRPKLTDFNARAWQTILGSKAAGVDFVLLSCYMAMGIPFEKPAFRDSIYLMGKNALAHYRKRFFSLNTTPNPAISTDLWYRFSDPLPEVTRYL